MDGLILSKDETSGGTLTSSLTAHLRASIMKGDIAPGEHLHLGDLKARFGVSLSPLREALTRLAAEGLVVAEGQRGYHVAPVSPENLAELIRLRCMAEGEALRESIRHGDDRWEEVLVAAHYRLQKLSGTPEPVPDQAWETAHRAYHLALVSACRMPLLLQFCRTLHDLGDRYRRLFLSQAPRDRHAPTEHEEMYRAALARDADAACAVLERHIRRTGSQVQRAITPSQGNAGPPQVSLTPRGAAAATRRPRGPQ